MTPVALMSRSSQHPRFPTYPRPVWRGRMVGKVTVERVTADAVGTVNWTPFDANPANRLPQAPHTGVLIYRGKARIQPNVDWRARRQNWRDESIVDHAYRVELDFLGNELPAYGGVADVGGGALPFIEMGDVIKCVEAVDLQLLTYIYIVRNTVPSTSSWSRTVLCDVNVDQEMAVE